MSALQLIEYHFAWPGVPLPPVDEHKLLDYVVGSNGVYARGRREGLEVCMPISFNLQPLRGLTSVASYAQWGYPKVPVALVETMLRESRAVCEPQPLEALYYLSYGTLVNPGPKMAFQSGWYLVMPEQEATDESVVARLAEAGEGAIIELHSHHSMRADFSPRDNDDEAQGFRVYCVIGTLFDRPTIRARVGLFGHFFEYPASEFFEMPEGLIDCVKG